MQLDSIVKDGYFYQVSSTDKANNIAKLCLLSCLEAFCRTADDLEPFYGNPNCDNTDQNVVDALYPRTYAKDSCDAILKFQMFIELFLKDILMEIDPMLVYDEIECQRCCINLFVRSLSVMQIWRKPN